MKKVLLFLGVFALGASMMLNIVLLTNKETTETEIVSEPECNDVYVKSAYIENNGYTWVKCKGEYGDTLVVFDNGTAVYPHFLTIDDGVLNEITQTDTIRIECRIYSGNIYKKYSSDNWYMYFLEDWILVSTEDNCYKFIPDPHPYDGEECPF